MYKLLYLSINLFTILGPLALSFDKRVRFYRNWKYVVPALFISGLVFLVWDMLFTWKKVWSFNAEYVTGISLAGLPLEEILFFITVPFACIFIYECLNYYIKRDLLAKWSFSISNLLIGFCIAMLFFAYNRIYTLVTFSLLMAILVYVEYFRGVTFMGRFYLAYVVSLVPFYIVNGLLTAIPVVLYNNNENVGLRIGTIPFEDHFYSMSMLLLNILLFEHFRAKAKKKAKSTAPDVSAPIQ